MRKQLRNPNVETVSAESVANSKTKRYLLFRHSGFVIDSEFWFPNSEFLKLTDGQFE